MAMTTVLVMMKKLPVMTPRQQTPTLAAILQR